MIHFGHRGRENLASLTIKDFAVKQDSDGALYVDKTTDEQTKNHQMQGRIQDFKLGGGGGGGGRT